MRRLLMASQQHHLQQWQQQQQAAMAGIPSASTAAAAASPTGVFRASPVAAALARISPRAADALASKSFPLAGAN